jgi:hypothetical protein
MQRPGETSGMCVAAMKLANEAGQPPAKSIERSLSYS